MALMIEYARRAIDMSPAIRPEEASFATPSLAKDASWSFRALDEEPTAQEKSSTENRQADASIVDNLSTDKEHVHQIAATLRLRPVDPDSSPAYPIRTRETAHDPATASPRVLADQTKTSKPTVAAGGHHVTQYQQPSGQDQRILSRY